MKTREKKYLIIGSTGHSVDALSWEDELPNVVDYDVIIVNTSTLTKDFLATVAPKKIESVRRALTRFLLSNGQLIVICDFMASNKNPNRYPDYLSNYSWLPIRFDLYEERGDTIEVINNPFPKYFSFLKKWAFFFVARPVGLHDEIGDICGKTYEVNY